MPKETDLQIIETARKKFGDREFARALQIYDGVENKSLLNDLDKSIIAHCMQYANMGNK